MRTRALLLSLALAGPCGAQPVTDDSLYQALGGRERIARFTDDFYDRMLADPRVAAFFDGINQKYLKRVLGDYLCMMAGGPCGYDGETMRNSHADLGLTRAHFNAVVEDLQDAMDAAGIPFGVQNRLLARLAPFHRDIVTR